MDNKKIGFQSIVGAILLSSICILVMAQASFQVSVKYVKKQSRANYDLLATERMERVKEWLVDQSSALNTMVFGFERYDSLDREMLEAYFKSYMDDYKNEYVYDIYYLTKENEMITSLGFDNRKKWPDMDFREREWYKTAIDNDDIHYSTAYKDKNSGSMIITISKRIVIDGKVQGVLAFDIFIDQMSKLLNGDDMPKNSYCFLVDSNYRVVTHPDEEHFGYDDTPKFMSDGLDSYDALYKGIKSDAKSISYEDYDKTERSFYYCELASNGWLVVVAIDNSLISEEAERLRDSMNNVGMLVMVLSLIVLVVYNIIELRGRKKVLRETQRKAKEEVLIAEKANKAKSAFLFNMSHDIRTPMNAIVGYTELARRYKNNPEKLEEYFYKVEVAEENLLRLINNVLEMARIENDRIVVTEHATDISVAIRKTLIVLSGEAEKKHITITGSDDLYHPYVYQDENHNAEIVANIIGNAIKYTPEGGTVDFRLIQHKGKDDKHCIIEFVCKDTGIGMSKDFLEHAFDSFERERNTTVSKIQGTGLGLGIVKKLVTLMNGTINIESVQGKGTTVTIKIPHRLCEKEDVIRDETDKDKRIVDFKGKRILLVEDNEMNQEIAAEILMETGLIVEIADNGKMACDKVLEKGPGWYDLILMDVQMPEMDGYEATRFIRSLKDSDLANIPIVAMTANAFEEDRQNAFEAGMNEHIPKPIEIKRLFNTLEKLL
ncbi:MAG: response regulator [Lachnospiraceae bacterium]|nr:response regulator [Lachnospiraceae bacterium]